MIDRQNMDVIAREDVHRKISVLGQNEERKALALEGMMRALRYFNKADKYFWICNEDAEHLATYLGALASKDKGGYCPSPVEVFKSGVVPPDYLDKFPPESQWYLEIQRYKYKNEIKISWKTWAIYFGVAVLLVLLSGAAIYLTTDTETEKAAIVANTLWCAFGMSVLSLLNLFLHKANAVADAASGLIKSRG